jgi:hypothetical protein
MTDNKQAHDDLSYVQSVVHRAEYTAGNPATIYFVWAVITFFGFAIIDVAPEKTGPYWMIAGPLGGLLSAVLGNRAGRAMGQFSHREGRLQAMHWCGLMVAVGLIVPLAMTHVIALDDFPRLVLLVAALSYYTAGVHVDRRLIPVSLVLAGCYLLTVFIRDLPHLWTVTATIAAASLTVAGLFAAARSRRAA